jgi:hypothetical protein
MREVFVLHPVMEKNLSQFSKIHFRFLGILPGKKTGQNGKNGGFEFLGEGGFLGERWYSRPPLRW